MGGAPRLFRFVALAAEHLPGVPRANVVAATQAIVLACAAEASAAAKALEAARQFELAMGTRTVAARLLLLGRVHQAQP